MTHPAWLVNQNLLFSVGGGVREGQKLRSLLSPLEELTREKRAGELFVFHPTRKIKWITRKPNTHTHTHMCMHVYPTTHLKASHQSILERKLSRHSSEYKSSLFLKRLSGLCVDLVIDFLWSD